MTQIPLPEACANSIREMSGAEFEPEMAADLWLKIINHKWLLSEKLGVVCPKAIMFFGPPGTGKTHFVKAIAGILSWWYIEILPSMLMAEGVEKIGANLREIMQQVGKLDEVVLFIDEFEEIAGCRDKADRIDKSITNEFLKQIPLLKNQKNKILLVCATNYIRQLDAAMLRPGRFDCVIPVGGLDREGRTTILEHYQKSNGCFGNSSSRYLGVSCIWAKTGRQRQGRIWFLRDDGAGYEKELYLKAELVKKEPNVEKALSLQDEISEAEGKFKQKMIGHLLRMKKINREAEME